MTGTASDRETRERLLRAAEQLFAERGFKAVTVREICGAAVVETAIASVEIKNNTLEGKEILAIERF